MLKNFGLITISIIALTACGVKTSATANQDKKEPAPAGTKTEAPAAPDITTESLRGGIYRLKGPGGNIGVLIGEDGAFVIDDKFDRFGQQILTNIKALTDKPVSYVINTHYHGDHTGANGKMKNAGAVIVAHDNVRTRMGLTFENKLWGSTVDAVDAVQWPTVTYSENATFHINGQTVQLIHTPSAHTDGDSIVYFTQANVLHMGDNYFNGMFPYVDIDGGGSLQGMIAAHDLALGMIDDETMIIPGHGNMSNKAELAATRARLDDILTRVKTAHADGLSLDDILAKHLLSDMKSFASFIDEDKMVRIAYRSLTEQG